MTGRKARKKISASRAVRAEEAPHGAGGQDRGLFERSPAGHLVVDGAGVVREANAAAARLCDRARDELVGLDLAALVEPADRDGLALHLRHVHDDAVAHRCDVRLARGRPAENEVWLQFESVVHDGFVHVVLGDITQRKRIEHELQTSEARYRQIVEATHEGIWIVDTAGDTTWVNDRMAAMLGYRAEEMSGRKRADLVWPEDRERAAVEWRRRRRDLGGRRAEFRYRHRDGHPVWCSVSSSAMLDARGDVTGFLGLYADVTERKQAELDLRRSEERLRLVLANSRDGIHQVDLATGRYSFMSPAQEELTGFTVEELTGMTLEEAARRLHPDDRDHVRHYLQRVIDGETPGGPMEYRWRVKSGEYRWFSDNRRLIRDAGGRPTGLVGVSRDVNDRREAEEALRVLNATLEQRVARRTEEVERQADQLRALAVQLSRTEQRERRRLARVLHDHIQQLMVAARMQLEWLRFDDGADRVQATIQAAKAILREALAASRSLTVDLSPPVLHEAGLVPALQWLANRMLEQHQVTVAVRGDTDAEPAGDEVRGLLFDCARELLFNVVKHAGTNAAEVTVDRDHDGNVRVTVRDGGRGFDPRLLTQRTADETSFGLFSIQQRISQLGGSLHVESAPDAGTTVTITAPAGVLGAPDAASARDHASEGNAGTTAEALAAHDTAGRRRVLIVDDHAIMREGLATMLATEADLEIVGEAADGPAAIDLVAELRPDVVIMDVNLGEMSGVEATRRVLEVAPATRVVGLSMHDDSDVALAMREAGACAYLAKGGPTEDLLAAIRADVLE